jgi:hypothetical protein
MACGSLRPLGCRFPHFNNDPCLCLSALENDELDGIYQAFPTRGTVVEMNVFIQRQFENFAGKPKQSLVVNVVVHGLCR